MLKRVQHDDFSGFSWLPAYVKHYKKFYSEETGESTVASESPVPPASVRAGKKSAAGRNTEP